MLSDSILDLGKLPNRKNHESESALFWLGHFAKSKIESESIFLIKYFIISILNFFWGPFGPLFTKEKKLIFHCVFKSCAEGFRVFFQARKLIFWPNGFYFPLNSHGVPKVCLFLFCWENCIKLVLKMPKMVLKLDLVWLEVMSFGQKQWKRKRSVHLYCFFIFNKPKSAI